MIDLFINHLRAEDKAGKTLDQYRGILKRFECWLHATHALTLSKTDVASVSALMLAEFYQDLYSRRFKTSTRNLYVVVLKEYFSFLTAMKLIPEDPSVSLHCVKEKKKPQDEDSAIYTAQDIEILLSFLSSQAPQRNALRDTAIVALLLGSGLRAFELCSLDVSHLSEIQAGVIGVRRKGGNWEKVNVSAFVFPHVARYLLARKPQAADEPLFLSQKGRRMTPNGVWKTLAAKQRSVQLLTGVHRFRHTFLTDVDRNESGNAAVARDLGGHKSVSVTNGYLHTTSEERQKVVNSMSYAGLLAESVPIPVSPLTKGID